MTETAAQNFAALLRSLEADPSSTGRHLEELEAAIADLMDAIVAEADEPRKLAMVLME
jgi:hypothetical protein